MLKLSEIKDLIKLIDQTSVSEIEIEHENSRVCIRKDKAKFDASAPPAAMPAIASAAYASPSAGGAAQSQPAAAGQQAGNATGNDKSAALHRIVSPMVGTFYHAPSPGAAPYVKVGDRVGERTVVCIVEAMKLMNEIEAEIKGEIVEILVENGQLVEFGQPLFLVKTE